MNLHVLATGPLTLVEDLGRPGRAAIGVGHSGAADRGSLRRGNRLLGNPENAAALEVLLGGLEIRAERPLWVCVTGAPAPAFVDERRVGHEATVRLPAWAVLRLGVPATGLRSYLCVRGGLDLPPVLGSRAHDTLSGLGPAPVERGDRLPVGLPTGALPDVDHVVVRPHEGPLRPVEGPRSRWASPLAGTSWTVSSDSDRVAVRLAGAPLTRRTGELASEGLLPGAVQVPPDGQPVLFLADAPVTGGYPVVAVLPEREIDRVAQLRPGDPVRFA